MPFVSTKLQRMLSSLRLGAHHSFQGRWFGERRSPARGMGLEFADYRSYQPGDDLRYVDWNLYARLERLYLKVLLQEQNLPVTLMVDTSLSMTLGQPSKLECARHLAGALGYVALAHQDTLRLLSIADGVRSRFPAVRGKGQFARYDGLLTGLTPMGETDLERVAADFLGRADRPGVVVVLTDGFSQTPYEKALKRLRTAGNELHWIHILADEELRPPPQGEFRLIDMETGASREIELDPATVHAYTEQLETFCREMRDRCLANEATYTRCLTHQPMEQILSDLRRTGVLHG